MVAIEAGAGAMHGGELMPESSVDVHKWWKYKNLRNLNLLLVLPLMSMFTIG